MTAKRKRLPSPFEGMVQTQRGYPEQVVSDLGFTMDQIRNAGGPRFEADHFF
jgi:hypothetical protein